MKIRTQWNYKYQKPRELSQEPCELKDDMPFKSIVERKLEAEAMGEAYEMALRKRFMLPVDKVDPLDVVPDMDSVSTPFDDVEDLGDAQKAYQDFMMRKSQVERYRRQVQARQPEPKQPEPNQPEPNQSQSPTSAQ